MNVSLTPELERRIRQKIDTGLYTTASEVVREGLRLLFEQDALRERGLARLRDEIDIGLAELDRREGIAAERVFEELAQVIDSARPTG